MSFPYRKPIMPLARRRRNWALRDVSSYRQEEQVGEGTYGQVWSARDKQTNERVALKRVKMKHEREGFPITALREINVLKNMKHDNIVSLKEIVTGIEAVKEEDEGSGTFYSIYLVFEYMDHDLTGLMDTPGVVFEEAHVKCYALQLLRGLQYCHERNVLHRDIKGSNLLIDNSGSLKIADLGLARLTGEKARNYTNHVITLWYRPPELLLGTNNYDYSVDMWSVGCLLAELFMRQPLFPGRDEADQMDLIFQLTGTPTEEAWPGWGLLPNSESVPKGQYKSGLAQKLRRPENNMSTEASHLIQGMLELDPESRFSASQALDHHWFRTEPVACAKKDLPKFKQSSHEFQTKRRRQMAYAEGRSGSAD